MFQPVKEDNLFKHTVYSERFPVGSTEKVCSIYFSSGITGMFVLMVNNQVALCIGNVDCLPSLYSKFVISRDFNLLHRNIVIQVYLYQWC